MPASPKSRPASAPSPREMLCCIPAAISLLNMLSMRASAALGLHSLEMWRNRGLRSVKLKLGPAVLMRFREGMPCTGHLCLQAHGRQEQCPSPTELETFDALACGNQRGLHHFTDTYHALIRRLQQQPICQPKSFSTLASCQISACRDAP